MVRLAHLVGEDISYLFQHDDLVVIRTDFFFAGSGFPPLLVLVGVSFKGCLLAEVIVVRLAGRAAKDQVVEVDKLGYLLSRGRHNEV